MKMEPIEGSETSAFKTQTPGKYPKENIIYKEHGENLKSRNSMCFVTSEITKMEIHFVCLVTLYYDKDQMRLEGIYKLSIRRLPTNKRESGYIHL